MPLLFEDQVRDTLRQKLEIEKDAKVNKISLRKYSEVSVKTGKKKYSKDKIAVIYAQGDINSGEGDKSKYWLCLLLQKAIKEAREDEKVKAIVLRSLNSPGGSALASETILRENGISKKQLSQSWYLWEMLQPQVVIIFRVKPITIVC